MFMLCLWNVFNVRSVQESLLLLENLRVTFIMRIFLFEDVIFLVTFFFRFKTSLSCQMSKVIKLWCAVSCFSPKKNLILKISFLGCMFRDLLLDANSSFNYLKNKWFYHYNSYTMYFCTQGYYSFGRKILKFFQNLSDTFEEYCIVCRVFVVFFMTSFGLH